MKKKELKPLFKPTGSVKRFLRLLAKEATVIIGPELLTQLIELWYYEQKKITKQQYYRLRDELAKIKKIK